MLSVELQPARTVAAEDRRRAILDAATRLFDVQGFSGTTTDEVAAEAGVTKRTLYRYMHSKEQLLFEIHERFLDRPVMEAVSGHSGSAVEQFTTMVETHVSVVIAHQQEIRVFLEDMKHLGPERRAEISRRRGTYEGMLGHILHAGMADGTFVQRDPALHARGILGSLTEMYRWYRPGGDSLPQDITSAVVSMFLDGLVPVSARRPGRAVDELLSEVPPVPHAADDDDPQERIFAAATDLFHENGYQKTTTRELAAAAGMTKGALFYHIGHKDAVLTHIHSAVIEDGIAMLQAAVSGDAPAPELLTKAMVAHCRIIDAHRDAIAVNSEEMKHLPPDALAELTERRDVYEGMLRAVVDRGVREGDFTVTNERLVTLTLLGLLNSTYRWYRRAGTLSPDDIGMRYADLVLHGLRAAPTRRRRAALPRPVSRRFG